MPPAKTKRTSPKAKSGSGFMDSLTRKLGPLPAWGWLAILAVGLYYYRHHAGYRHHAATGAGSVLSAPGSGGGGFGDSGAGGGGGGPSSDQGKTPPYVPVSSAAPDSTTPGTTTNNTYNTYNTTNTGGGAGSSPATGNGGAATKQKAAAAALIPSAAQAAKLAGSGAVKTPLLTGIAAPNIPTAAQIAAVDYASTHPTMRVPASSPNFQGASVAKTEAAAAAGVPVAFGGVVSAKINPRTGVTTTTYASGRVVTQAPGKTAYVSAKGNT